MIHQPTKLQSIKTTWWMHYSWRRCPLTVRTSWLPFLSGLLNWQLTISTSGCLQIVKIHENKHAPSQIRYLQYSEFRPIYLCIHLLTSLKDVQIIENQYMDISVHLARHLMHFPKYSSQACRISTSSRHFFFKQLRVKRQQKRTNFGRHLQHPHQQGHCCRKQHHLIEAVFELKNQTEVPSH